MRTESRFGWAGLDVEVGYVWSVLVIGGLGVEWDGRVYVPSGRLRGILHITGDFKNKGSFCQTLERNKFDSCN